jgi:alkanesulfonate monooxygenase SsuD/methylene tetrahydromethanopterin reductase-like flavin-dependent oxidoreductase (luciferase family)
VERIRFGIVAGFGSFDPEALVADAVHAESAGFDLFSLPDHLHSGQPTLEPWTALAFVAASTERLAVLTNVLGLPYRPPAVTAKMAETLDRLSVGRLVLGLGVGGYDAEFAAFGLAERTPGQKVAALDEAMRIIRGLWEEPSFTLEGEHFHVREAQLEPKPDHHIPIWTGAYGPKALRVTAALADGWIPSIGRLGLAAASDLRATVLSNLHEAGRNPEEFTFATNLVVSFEPELRRGAVQGWQQISGDSETITDAVAEIASAGFTVLNVALRGRAAAEQFASEVIPAVRARVPIPG